MTEPTIPVQVDATWLLEIVDWGRARGMSDPDIFAKLLEILHTAVKGEAPADYAAEGKVAEGE